MTAAVIVHYRTPELTAAAVASMARAQPTLDRIIVVDNGSPDEETLREPLTPACEVMRLPRNVGFSAGCNAGIRRALADGAECVLLLNSDAAMEPGTLDVLQRVFDEHQACGIAAPVTLSPDGGTVESCGIQYEETTGRMRLRHAGQAHGVLVAGAGGEVQAVTAAAMLVRREVFDGVGLLDEDFFFGFEDIEFCLRARDAGFRVHVAPAAVVRHRGHASIGRRSPRRLYFASRNHLLLASRRPRPRFGRAVRAASIVSWSLLYALTNRDVPRAAGLRAVWRGVRDHLAGRYGDAP